MSLDPSAPSPVRAAAPSSPLRLLGSLSLGASVLGLASAVAGWTIVLEGGFAALLAIAASESGPSPGDDARYAAAMHVATVAWWVWASLVLVRLLLDLAVAILAIMDIGAGRPRRGAVVGILVLTLIASFAPIGVGAALIGCGAVKALHVLAVPVGFVLAVLAVVAGPLRIPQLVLSVIVLRHPPDRLTG